MSAFRTDLAPILDMVEHAERAIQYAQGVTLTELIADQMRSDAMLRVVSILGEASNRVSQATRDRFTDLPWNQMRGMRNIVIHRYDLVHWQTVWDVATLHIPAMMTTLLAVRDILTAELPPPPELPSDA